MTATETILEMPTKNKNDFISELAGCISRVAVIRRDELLAKHTTLRVGGPADVYIEPVSEDDLSGIVKFCGKRGLHFFIMGCGSNLLVRDGGFRGVIICLVHPHFSRVEVVGERLRCGAGARVKNVAIKARQGGLSGVEFLEGIPGSVGGALRMNAGAMGGATFDVVESVRCMDYAGEVHECTRHEIPVEYRCCPLLKDHIALGAVFKCVRASREEVGKRMKAFSERRWKTQPVTPSAGCIFKNPEKIPAGRLMDELGLKGTRVGGAMVSAEHGNFIINDNKATARDILELIGILKQHAKTKRGMDLHTEIEIIGEE
jgi:UDP-N-acetylenolpyruvoylglucosamine reductase